MSWTTPVFQWSAMHWNQSLAGLRLKRPWKQACSRPGKRPVTQRRIAFPRNNRFWVLNLIGLPSSLLNPRRWDVLSHFPTSHRRNLFELWSPRKAAQGTQSQTCQPHIQRHTPICVSYGANKNLQRKEAYVPVKKNYCSLPDTKKNDPDGIWISAKPRTYKQTAAHYSCGMYLAERKGWQIAESLLLPNVNSIVKIKQ